MPWTGTFFTVGAVAAAGLPMLNGFIGEWLIALGLADTVRHGTAGGWSLAFGLPALAFAGALAVASFVRLFGAVFLGQPRTEDASVAKEAPRTMLLPMAVLALLCAAVGLWPTMILRPVLAAAGSWLGSAIDAPAVAARLLSLIPSYATLGVVILVLAGARFLFFRRIANRPGTWDCGYARPTPKMQYASGLGAWISGLLPRVAAPVIEAAPPRGLFPVAARFETHAPDPFETRVYEPLFVRWAQRFERVRALQQGRLRLYLVYILVTTVAALLWAVVQPRLSGA
jgi:NADH:ubiquinone oxidoreductase subunit 5 (subunit L)/multisubunit Na+/H+ antiporter MnhA subunit